ncbi:anti-sigma factor [Rhodobacteraceae bacterium KMM 6894]|nr:anti-sigma factor [Rhodobacteraceae bacterium KMM 6894]
MSADPSDRDQDKAQAGEYALGLLEPAEAAAFEARLVQDPDLRALLATWADDFAAFTDDIPQVAPPAHLKAALETALFPSSSRNSARFGWIMGGLLAASLAVVLLLNAGAFAPRGPGMTAMIAAENGAMLVAAAYDATDGTLTLERTAGAAAPGRALELWLIAQDNAPVSLGVLTDDTRTTVTVPAALRAQMSGSTLAISDEPSGGSPTGAPTGAVLAAGAVTPA